MISFQGSKTITLHGQKVNFKSFEAHNGIVHELQTDLNFIPPRKGNLHEILQVIQQYSMFFNIMDQYYPGLLKHSNNFELTFLVAPNNIISDALSNGLTEEKLAQILLLNHIIPNSWYSIALQNVPKYSLGGKLLENLNLTLTDFTAENGVFHEVNSIVF